MSIFGNKIDTLSSNLDQPFTIADISRIIRADSGEEDTVALDSKIRYHINRLKIPRVGRKGPSILFDRGTTT